MRNLVFVPDGHRYFEDGVEIPSLSKVLRLGGAGRDLRGIPEAILLRKTQIGTALHRAVELYLSNELDWTTIHPEVEPYVNGALEYLHRDDRKILAVEKPVGGTAIGYACTPDLVVEGGVVEWKTAYRIEPEVEIQLAGQARAVVQGVRQARHIARRVVQLKKDGTYVIKDYGTDGDSVFRAALRVAQWRMQYEPKSRRHGTGKTRLDQGEGDQRIQTPEVFTVGPVLSR